MSDEETPKVKAPPCTAIRNELKQCLIDSDCYKLRKKSAKQCLLDGDVSEECIHLRYRLFQCKRSLLDNRQRFRGRKD